MSQIRYLKKEPKIKRASEERVVINSLVVWGFGTIFMFLGLVRLLMGETWGRELFFLGLLLLIVSKRV